MPGENRHADIIHIEYSTFDFGFLVEKHLFCKKLGIFGRKTANFFFDPFCIPQGGLRGRTRSVTITVTKAKEAAL